MKKTLVAIFTLAIIAISFYRSSHTTNSVRQAGVTTSFYPLYFFTSQIIGVSTTSNPILQITNITPSYTEPHDYELNAQNIRDIQSSKLLVAIGLHFEPWFSKLSVSSSTHILAVGNNLQDPHIWLSPKKAILIVQKITQALFEVDPEHASQYIENSQILIDQLISLDTEYTKGLAVCAKKEFITSHTAFGYMAKDYSLTQKGIVGLSPEAEPTPKEFAHIIEFAKTNKVKVIFFESTVSPKLSQTIAKEIGAQTMILDPIEGISEDAQAKGENYFSIMRKNLVNLRVALECK